MKTLYIIAIATLLFSCNNKKISPDKKENKTVIPEFQKIIDSSYLKGSILIYDLTDDKYYTNDYKWAKNGKLPASTFKVPNSIIALETGTIENDSTLFKWNGEKRMIKNWEQDLTLKDAFHFSCVPCYQEIARNIDFKKMSQHLDKLQYGNIDVDSTYQNYLFLNELKQ